MLIFSIIWFTQLNIFSFYIKRKMVLIMGESLSRKIKLANNPHNKDSLEKILIQMQPLVKKYIRKLYFMDKEDASQELNLSLIEAIYHIKYIKNDAMCLAYLQKSIINKYNYLCKLNLKFVSRNNEFEKIPDNIPYIERFTDIEVYIDMNDFLKSKNNTQKCIIIYYLKGLSDNQIALKLGKSRQYVNRIKKILINEYLQKMS